MKESHRQRVKEVDLHRRGRDSAVMERQLATVRGELNSALRGGGGEIILIHGMGSGRLREAIHDLISHEYPGCSCHDAPFARYGFQGATVVKIKREREGS